MDGIKTYAIKTISNSKLNKKLILLGFYFKGWIHQNPYLNKIFGFLMGMEI